MSKHIAPLRAFRNAAKTFTYSTPHRPIVSGWLECGHFHHVEYTGHDPHDESKWIIPTEPVPCESCKKQAEELDLIPELVAKSIYSRFRPWGTNGIITFYAKHPTSPTGVMSCGGVTATPEAEALIRKLDSRKSPLSPTEGLSRR